MALAHKTHAAEGVDVGAMDYPALRAAFNRALAQCTHFLTRAEFQRGADAIGFDYARHGDDGSYDMLTDAAIFSPVADRPGARRAIDRLARKLAKGDDAEVAALAPLLPAAKFSVYRIADISDGVVTADDLLTAGRRLAVRDNGLSQSGKAGLCFGARLLEAGRWSIGFGILIPMRKSEVLALKLVAGLAEGVDLRASMHEPVYMSRLYGTDLVVEVLSGVISTFARLLDDSSLSLDEASARIDEIKFLTAQARRAA